MAERACAGTRRAACGERASARVLVIATALLAQGCPIDDRKLVEAVADGVGSAGGAESDASGPRSGTGGDSGGGGGSVASDSGSEAAAPPPSLDAGPCVHTGPDGGLDCEDTVLFNADFNRDLAWWAADPYDKGARAEWSPDDGQDAAGSGSLLIRNLDQRALSLLDPAHVQQCVPAVDGTAYELTAEIFIEGGQTPRGQAEASVFFFEKPDCLGASRGTGVKAFGANPSAWTTIRADVPSQTDVASMMVLLSATKPLEEGPFEVLFDAVRVRPK